jgi:hypothetical protein
MIDLEIDLERLALRRRGWTASEFADLFRDELRDDVLLIRVPPELLNPNYWEPLTRSAEEEVRSRVAGVIVWNERIWRADAVAPGRHFREDVPAILLCGYAFRIRGDRLDFFARAGGRLEFVAFRGLPTPTDRGTVQAAHGDLVRMRLSAPGATLAFASGDPARAAFASRALLERAVAEAVRSHVRSVADADPPVVPAPAVAELLRLAGGRPVRSEGVVERDGAWEMGLRIGDDDEALLYYESATGILEVVA